MEESEPEVEESPEPTPEEEDAGSEVDEAEEEEDNAEVADLAAEIDSADEDEAAQKAISQFKTGQDVGSIPRKAKKGAKPAASDDAPGVVYVGRIPHGFYEHEMRQYFTQFGAISKLRLSRNKRTGASKHFAFVEFDSAATAEVVAKTMDSYLLFGHVLKCKVVAPERVHKDLWKGANRRFKIVPHGKIIGKELAKPVTTEGWERRVKKEEKRRVAKAAQLKELGYEFEAPALKEIPAPAPVEVVMVDAEAEPAQVEAVETKAPEPVVEEKAVPEKAEPEKTEEPAAKAAPKGKKGPKAKKAKGKA